MIAMRVISASQIQPFAPAYSAIPPIIENVAPFGSERMNSSNFSLIVDIMGNYFYLIVKKNPTFSNRVVILSHTIPTKSNIGSLRTSILYHKLIVISV